MSIIKTQHYTQKWTQTHTYIYKLNTTNITKQHKINSTQSIHRNKHKQVKTFKSDNNAQSDNHWTNANGDLISKGGNSTTGQGEVTNNVYQVIKGSNSTTGQGELTSNVYQVIKGGYLHKTLD